MPVEIFEQKTCESCLAVCLMTLLKSEKGIKIEDDEEYNILFEGLKFTKIDFSTGHLNYLAKKYPEITFEQYVDYDIFHKILSNLTLPANVRLYSQKINLTFLKEMVAESPVIIYMDMYTLDGIYHYSHFVILTDIDNENAVIHDPWVGKRIELRTKALIRSISYVRNMLKISPKLIKIR